MGCEHITATLPRLGVTPQDTCQTGVVKKFYSGTFYHAIYVVSLVTSYMESEANQMTEKKKSYYLLIIGSILLVLSIICAVYTHNTSYHQSTEIATQLTEVKNQLAAIEKGTASGDPETLNIQKAALSDEKLALEKPYSFALTAVFIAVMLTLKGLYNALIGLTPAQKTDIRKLTLAGLLAALCYIGFAFLKIDIPVGPEKTAFHFGNVFCVLAALLLGGYWGGLAGAVGMTIADLTTAYVTSAPKTFLLKLCIGLIVGLVAHKICKLSRKHTRKYITGVTIAASAAGMIFNIIADPLVGYFYKTYLLGVPQNISSALAKMSALTTSVNAVVAVIAASAIYLALLPALKKSGLFIQVNPEASGASESRTI